MADHSKPTVLSTESGFVSEMHDRINDTARLFDATDVPISKNQPTGTQRVNRSIASLQRWSGTAWQTFGGYIPSSTVMLFVMPTAPVGWTKLTTHDNKALRIVSGTGGGSGGSVAFTTAFASKSVAGSISSTVATGSISSTSTDGSIGGTIGATTLTANELPPHGHTILGHVGQDQFPFSGGGGWPGVGTSYSAASASVISGGGGGGSHTHSHSLTFTGTSHGHTLTGTAHGHTFTGTDIDIDVLHVDAIICRKD